MFSIICGLPFARRDSRGNFRGTDLLLDRKSVVDGRLLGMDIFHCCADSGMPSDPLQRVGVRRLGLLGQEGVPQAMQPNDGLARLAGSMRRRGATQEQIESELLAANIRRCKPPLDDAEVRKIA